MSGVLRLLAQILGGLAFAMLPPAAIALVEGERSDAETFLLVSGLTGFVAGAMFFALRGRRWRPSRGSALSLVVAAWCLPPLIAAIPFLVIADSGLLQAIFEAVSGLTTTGATTFRSVQTLGSALIFWRAELEWLGGLLTLIMVAVVLSPMEVGGLTARNVAILGPVGEGGIARSFGAARAIFVAYSAATIVCIALLVVTGLPVFDAVCLGFSTLSTGGYLAGSMTIGAYDNLAAEIVLAVFMLVAATSIVWHQSILRGRWQLVFSHRESYWVIGVALGAGLLFAWSMSDAIAALTPLEALRYGLFTGISVVSTTGFEPWLGAFDFLPLAAVCLLALVGGGTLSAAGGIKFYRVGGMFVQSMHELQKLIYPHSVRSTRFGGQPYDIDLMKALWASAVVALSIVALAAILLSLSLPTFDGSALAAVAAFSNVGQLYPAVSEIGIALPHYAELDSFATVVLIAVMLLGRIEAVALLAVFSLAYWRA